MLKIGSAGSDPLESMSKSHFMQREKFTTSIKQTNLDHINTLCLVQVAGLEFIGHVL
jgi:hypothetical protein